MMKRLLLFIIPALLAGCNIAIFVSKDNIIIKENGYILIIANNQYVEFIPSKIDTSLSLSENFARHKIGKAFYLNGLFSKELDYLKIFGDTISNGLIVVPVEIEYRKKKEENRQLKKQQKEYQVHYIKVGNVVYDYQINTCNIRLINASPLLSEEIKIQKTKNYED